MHPQLLRGLDAAVAHFRGDPRCVGMYLHGSIGRGETDAYSDVDVCAVIEDADYEAVKAEMRGVCERAFGPVVIWLPEGERPNYCNFAFLFQHGSELLLTDFDIIARSLFVEWNQPPDRILWDRDGVLASVAAVPRRTPDAATGEALHMLDTYWVYAYLSGKYWRRGDLFKLLYVQQTLLHLHVRLLGLLHRGAGGQWWAGDIAHLPGADRERMRAYFTQADPADVAASLAQALDLFHADAINLCADLGVVYPPEREEAVRRHLAAMGLPVRARGEPRCDLGGIIHPGVL